MGRITQFISTKLKLKVNEQKSAVARPWERKFPGFSFTANREPKRRIAPKAVLRFKEKVRELTRRARGVSTERMAEDLSRCLRGWMAISGNARRHRCWTTLRSGSGAGFGLRRVTGKAGDRLPMSIPPPKKRGPKAPRHVDRV
jgi:hypothetical protein